MRFGCQGCQLVKYRKTVDICPIFTFSYLQWDALSSTEMLDRFWLHIRDETTYRLYETIIGIFVEILKNIVYLEHDMMAWKFLSPKLTFSMRVWNTKRSWKFRRIRLETAANMFASFLVSWFAFLRAKIVLVGDYLELGARWDPLLLGRPPSLQKTWRFFCYCLEIGLKRHCQLLAGGMSHAHASAKASMRVAFDLFDIQQKVYNSDQQFK